MKVPPSSDNMESGDAQMQELNDLTGKDFYMITAQPEEGADKMAAVECWNISVDFSQKIRVFRNSIVSAGTLRFIGDSFLAGGAAKKPWISVWPLNQPTPIQPPLLIPATANCIAVSPDGGILVVAMNNKLSVFELGTGDFVAYLTRHYGQVSCLAFSLCGRHFASAGQDGTVFVWKTADVFSVGAAANPQAVTCQGRIENMIFAGADPSYSFLVTVGADHACRVYDSFAAGQGPMGSFLFRRPLVAVSADFSATNLAISDDGGAIFRLPLITADSRSSHPHMLSESDWNQRYQFSGHSKAARCLQFSSDGSLLISGSDDLTARVWQVKSRVCIRVLQFRGPVTNLQRCLYPESVVGKRNFVTAHPLSALKKQLASDALGTGEKYSDIRLPARGVPQVGVAKKDVEISNGAKVEAVADRAERTGQSGTERIEQSGTERIEQSGTERIEHNGDGREVEELRQLAAELTAQLREQEHQVATLKNVNRELYDLAREKMLELRKT